MKIYVVEYDNIVRMLKEEHRNNRTEVVYLADVLTQERIVMAAECLRAITLKEYESTDELKRENEKSHYSEAVTNFNALRGYLNGIDDSAPIIAALAIIQDFLEQKERELRWE